MNYRPLGNRVIVKILEKNQVSIAGITLAVARGRDRAGNSTKEWADQCLWAEIMRTGPDVTAVEVGQVVVISGAAGKWLDKDLHTGSDLTHRVVYDDEILCIDLDKTAELQRGAPHHV